MIDKEYFIKRQPSLELFYDTILHRKVRADVYSLIPKGSKVLAWFTYNRNKDVCLLMHLNRYNKIINVEQITLCFDRKLSYGTILFGTYFTNANHKFISCEDIYYHKGENTQQLVYKERFELLRAILASSLQQKAYTKDFVIFGLPYMTNNLHDAFTKIKELQYPIHAVSCRQWNGNNPDGILLNKQVDSVECIFKVKADVEQDIYNLYCRGYKTDEIYSFAGIFDYKTSVMMNNLFRTIKENANLDRLEESDDEAEFEDISEDKFVNLKKIVYMRCAYVKKFRKWKPIECVKFGEKLQTKNEIMGLERQ
jgi:hypothetical protein